MAKKLQSSARGKIRRLLLIEELSAHKSFRVVLLQLAEKKSSHTQLAVWSNTKIEQLDLIEFLKIKDIEVTRDPKNFDPGVILILPIIFDFPIEFNLWVRDPFVIFQEGTPPSLQIFALEYFKDGHGSAVGAYNLGVAEKLHRDRLIGKIENEEKWFSFHGGNVLSDHDFVLVGGNQFDKMMERLRGCPSRSNITCEEGKKMLAELLKVKADRLYVVGSKDMIEKPPLLGFDYQRKVDLYTNLYKKENWFDVYDEVLAFRSPILDYKYQVHIDLFITVTGEYKNKKPVILLAKLKDISYGSSNGEVEILNDALDELELDFADSFCIIRNSVPYVQMGPSLYLYYNNCLVENSLDSKKVWLPRYLDLFDDAFKLKIKECEDDNVKKWDALHFKVEFIEADFLQFSAERGGLHCMTKEIIRIM